MCIFGWSVKPWSNQGVVLGQAHTSPRYHMYYIMRNHRYSQSKSSIWAEPSFALLLGLKMKGSRRPSHKDVIVMLRESYTALRIGVHGLYRENGRSISPSFPEKTPNLQDGLFCRINLYYTQVSCIWHHNSLPFTTQMFISVQAL